MRLGCRVRFQSETAQLEWVPGGYLGWQSVLTCGRVLHLVVFVYACVAVHRFRKAKKRVRLQRMGFEIARTVVEERKIPVDYRYT